jgi:hypothetical protein
VLHLPRGWPWQAAWAQLHTTVTATGPPRSGLTPRPPPHGARPETPTVEEPDRPATPSRPRSLSKITQPITAPPTMRAVGRVLAVAAR